MLQFSVGDLQHFSIKELYDDTTNHFLFVDDKSKETKLDREMKKTKRKKEEHKCTHEQTDQP